MSRNQREGRFIGFKSKGWHVSRGGDGEWCRFTYYYRGTQGKQFRAADLREKGK